MARYLNQMPGSATWYDHLGNERDFNGRNDFYWHRTMIWFTGYVGTPKFTYMATIWTIFPTQQTLVYGNLKYSFNKYLKAGNWHQSQPLYQKSAGTISLFYFN